MNRSRLHRAFASFIIHFIRPGYRGRFVALRLDLPAGVLEMNRRIVLPVLLALSLGPAFVAHADPPVANQDQDAKPSLLDGVWVVKSMEQVGMKLEGEKLPVPMRGMKRVFDKQRMTIKRLNREYKCTFTVDNDKTPKHMDLVLESEGRAPRTLKCIYEIKEDTLRLAESQQERPTSFETDRTMRRITVYTFTRQVKRD